MTGADGGSVSQLGFSGLKTNLHSHRGALGEVRNTLFRFGGMTVHADSESSGLWVYASGFWTKKRMRRIAATINEARTPVGAGAVLQPNFMPALIESAQDEGPAA